MHCCPHRPQNEDWQAIHKTDMDLKVSAFRHGQGGAFGQDGFRGEGRTPWLHVVGTRG